MDKWEKVVTLKRKLTDLRHGLTIEELQECLECDRSTVYRIKDLAEMLFGIDIIKDKQTKKFRFDFENSELTELPGLWFKKSELEALICLQHAMSGLQRDYLKEILAPFSTRFEPLLKAQGIDITVWQERFKILSIFSRDINHFNI